MGWTNPFFSNIVVTNNIAFNNGYLSNGDGTYTSTPGEFLYSGIPAAGNLIYSSTNANGVDKFGNNYLAGTTWYDNGAGLAISIQFGSQFLYYTMTANPGATFFLQGNLSYSQVSGLNQLSSSMRLELGGDLLLNSASSGVALGSPGASVGVNGNGSPEVLNSGDGNLNLFGILYTNGRTNTVVNSGSFTGLKNFTVQGGVVYNIRVTLVYSGNQNAGAPMFSFTHGGGAGALITDAVGWTDVDGSNIGVWQNASLSDRTGPTLDTGGHKMTWDMDFTAPGSGTSTLTFSVACSIAADTWNAKAFNCYLRRLT